MVAFFVFIGGIMPEVTKEGSETPLEVRIKQVRNGFRVCGLKNGEPTEYEYVFTKLNKALKEVEPIFSVLSEDDMKVSEDDLDAEEKRINRKED